MLSLRDLLLATAVAALALEGAPAKSLTVSDEWFDCDNDCGATNCSSFQHDMWTKEISSTGWTGGIHGCQAGSCEGHGHEECQALLGSSGTAGDALDAVWLEARGGDARKISHVLRTHPAVRLNRQRRAVQLLGCGGIVVAHLPLTAETWRMLTDG